MDYKLSSSKLNLLVDCPRCFWLAMTKNIKRPSGPMSSIPIKMDSIIKHYFNGYRGNQLPPILNGQINGRLAVGMPLTLRSDAGNGIVLWGRPDDFIELEDSVIVVLDHKTASKTPTVVHPSYKLQMSIYSYLLKEMGYKTTNKAYLAYFTPDECELHAGMKINCSIIEVITDLSHVSNLLNKAHEILSGTMPESGEHCEFCRWAKDVIDNISILSRGRCL